MTKPKHIDVRFHFIKQFVKNSRILASHVGGSKNKADRLAKSLGKAEFEGFLEKPANYRFRVMPDLQCVQYSGRVVKNNTFFCH